MARKTVAEQSIENVEQVSTAIVIPGVGDVVDLANPDDAAIAYDRLVTLGNQVDNAKLAVRRALVEHAERYGGNTMRLGSAEVTVTRPDEIKWDLAILRELRDAGLPQARWDKLVTETVDRKVSAVVAKQIARANPEYAAIIDRAQTRRPKNPTVSVALRAAS